MRSCFFFFNDTATTEIYTLSLHDALPICCKRHKDDDGRDLQHHHNVVGLSRFTRSEEHTSELQSLTNLVCRLLLEKKNSSPVYEPTPKFGRPAWPPHCTHLVRVILPILTD